MFKQWWNTRLPIYGNILGIFVFPQERKKSLEYAHVNKKSPVNIFVCDIEICEQKANKIN